MDKIAKGKRIDLKTVFPFLGLIAVMIFFQAVSGGRVFTPKNLKAILNDSFFILIATVAFSFVMAVGNLDLSMGTLTDQGGALLLEKLPAFPNVKKLDLHYNYLSEEMAEKLKGLSAEVDVSEINKPDIYRDEVYRNAMLTE